LLVEDDAAIGTAMHDAPEAHGFGVTLHSRGADVAGFAAEVSPDLVLLDAGLPDIDGFTLCRLLRSQHAELLIVLMTVRDADIDIVVGLDAYTVSLAIIVQRSIIDSEVVGLRATIAHLLTEIKLPVNPTELATLQHEPDAPPPFGIYDKTAHRVYGVEPETAYAAVRAAEHGPTSSRTSGAIIVATALTDRSQNVLIVVRVSQSLARPHSRARRSWPTIHRRIWPRPTCSVTRRRGLTCADVRWRALTCVESVAVSTRAQIGRIRSALKPAPGDVGDAGIR
jgi:CheY-like chemotaxis protein